MEKGKHRKLMVETSQQLSSEEFSNLVYLLCVPDELLETPQCDRIPVLKYLERHQVVSPNKYENLFWALKSIHREDIINRITTENPEVVFPVLPSMPQNFGTQKQAWIVKQSVMLDKKKGIHTSHERPWCTHELWPSKRKSIR